MYELHAWPTPNGYKVSILLEELGQPYEVVPVDIGAGDQFRPEFLRISPNNKMPAMRFTSATSRQPAQRGMITRSMTPRRSSCSTASWSSRSLTAGP